MNAITQKSATSGQIRQISRFGSDAIEKALVELGLDKPGAQRVIEHGDDFAEAIRMAAINSLNELVGDRQFEDEEVQSSYAYPEDYKVKGITEQTNILRQLFPGIGFADEKIAEQPLPPNAEGWFAIPKWETLAPTYGEAVEKVLDAIRKARGGKFYNCCEGLLGPDSLRQSDETVKMFQKLGDEQKDHDILVVPCQFGLWHRGRSVRRVREVMQVNEFGLGAFAVGIMILTHPERLMNYDDLWIDCAGDEFAPYGSFLHAPAFGFINGEVVFDADSFDKDVECFGSASAFLPQ
jgi:hypothetical protein